MKRDKNLFDDLGLPPVRLGSTLDRLAPPPPGAGALPGGAPPIDRVAEALTRGPTAPPTADRKWRIHERFVQLHLRYGRHFERFVGDVLDILLPASIQTRFLEDWVDRAARRRRSRSDDPLSAEGAKQVRLADDEDRVTIGGEPRYRPRHYLHRKSFLGKVFLDPNEYSAFSHLFDQVEQVVSSRGAAAVETDEISERGPGAADAGQGAAADGAVAPDPAGPATGTPVLPTDREARRRRLLAVIDRLRGEITRDEMVEAWQLLAIDEFADLDQVFEETQKFNLVRPGSYDELDHAYRDGKRLLKLLIAEFEAGLPVDPAKRPVILDYLREVITVYTHHHFVLKHLNRSKVMVSRHKIEAERRRLESRLAELSDELGAAKAEIARLLVQLETARGEASQATAAARDLAARLKKAEANEVLKRLADAEAAGRKLTAEFEQVREANREHRLEIRELIAENERLADQLRKLHQFPDEKAVTGLLTGMRVVIFGGIGKDHYWPVLSEAGVKLEDYEWYEGYQTISQSRTDEIVGRCDLVVIITCYCGHLILWQTRDALKNTDKQVIRIHNSGAGSLRHHLLERFGGKSGRR